MGPSLSNLLSRIFYAAQLIFCDLKTVSSDYWGLPKYYQHHESLNCLAGVTACSSWRPSPMSTSNTLLNQKVSSARGTRSDWSVFQRYLCYYYQIKNCSCLDRIFSTIIPLLVRSFLRREILSRVLKTNLFIPCSSSLWT